MSRIIFHIDMDAFYASVEQRDHPEYRGKPVVVGAKVGTRGVVSAASYEARRFGIRSAMPISEAYARCPGGVFVQPRMEVYQGVSASVMKIFSTFSPTVEQISVDEAFLDMTGSGRLFGSPMEVACSIKATIRKECALSASIGIAPNKFCAKIASDINKPDGITVCPSDPEEVVQWLAPMDIRKIWGVGAKTAAVFAGMSITTIHDLQKVSLEKISERFGKQGAQLYYLARGIDARPLVAEVANQSISREHTFNSDTGDRELWRSTLFSLTQDVARRARKHGVKGSTVTLTYRRPDFTRCSRQRILRPPSNVARFIFEGVMQLLQQVHEPSLRLIGVGISGFDTPLQTDLFEVDDRQRHWEKSEIAADKLCSRFGSAIIKKGTELDGQNS